ncbi:MAG: hypothetical protein QOG35_759 [Solirubrobacteraceae bacterium]|nr:hypothetical protein [Solirubrobacteraceae bacterium]
MTEPATRISTGTAGRHRMPRHGSEGLLIRRSLVRIQAGALGVTTPVRRWVALRGESVAGESDDPL